MGKTAFAQLTAYDLTAIFFVITLAVGPLVTEKITYSIAGMIAVGAVHIGFSKLSLFNRLNKVFIGQPTIVIKHGKLIRTNLKRSRITLVELLSGIREKGYPDLTRIDYAIIEPNGGISILPKQDVAPVTPKQLGIKTTYQGLPIAVIIEGEIQYKNLKLINKSEKWLKNELSRVGCPDQKNIFYATVTENDYLLTIDSGEGSL